MSETTYKGSCFCGSVEFEAKGAPAKMGYCHCEDCASWSASPINAFTLWPPESVKVVSGEEHVGTFNKTENSYRKFCNKCGGHLMADHPGMGLVDIYAAVLTDFTFEPMLHVHYNSKTVSVNDGLPKFKDLPEPLGGSGEILQD